MSQIENIEKLEANEKLQGKKGLNPFVLLFTVLAIMTAMTYFLPAGNFDRETVNGRDIVVAGTYHSVAQSPVSPFGLFAAIHQGLVEAAPIGFYVIIIGGMIAVMNKSGALPALLSVTSKRLSKNGFLFIAGLMLLFSLGGTLIGMAEESLIYLPIVIPFILAMGYDVLTGAAVVLLGMSIGATTAIMNPFTIGIAQSIAQVPMFSGIKLRLVLYCIYYVASVAFVYNYARKVKKDPSIGVYGDRRYENSLLVAQSDMKLTTRHKLILGAWVLGIIALVVGTFKFDFYMSEYSAVFIILAIVIGIIAKMSTEELINTFMEGGRGILTAALIIGLARGIVVVLNNGNIIDTILNAAATTLQHAPSSLVAGGMFVFQAMIHFLVPSSSGQAMLTIPIMAPLGDLLGVSRQTVCLIFTLADATGNTILPTSGYFMAALAVSGISWNKWVKHLGPFIIAEYLFGICVVIIVSMLHYGV